MSPLYAATNGTTRARAAARAWLTALALLPLALAPDAVPGARLQHLAARRATQPAAWRDPSPHRVREVLVAPGVRLEVLDWGGAGPPLVFLAGYGNSAHVFDEFAPRFRDSYRVIAITRRGFGASTLAFDGYDNQRLARDVVAVLDSLRLRRPILVAHSFGGAELNALAADYPAVARGLVYLDGGFDFAELYADSGWTTTPIPRPPPLPNHDGSPRAATAYAAEMTGPGYPESEVRVNTAWGARVTRTPAFRADSLPTWLMRGTPAARWRAIRVPALAIYGVPATVEQKYPWVVRGEPELRSRAARRFAVETPLLARQQSRFRAEVAGGRVLEIAGGRHYVFLTHPREVAQAIRDFARSTASASTR